MGYTTTFNSELIFVSERTTDELRALQKLIKEGRVEDDDIDLEITKEFTGIEWNGSEKCYNMEPSIQYIIDRMKETYPNFSLSGTLYAQGEDFKDRYELKVIDNKVVRKDYVFKGKKIICPECELEFYNE